jgi:hypothetical protein
MRNNVSSSLRGGSQDFESTASNLCSARAVYPMNPGFRAWWHIGSESTASNLSLGEGCVPDASRV